MNILNAFTVDVEDYYHVSAFESGIERRSWPQFPSRIRRNTHRLLELLASHRVQGTFFVLGWVAERYPELVREIDSAGHEIGSHGYWHRLIYTQTPKEFRDDLRQSLDVLRQITGTPVTTYRAPSFSITKRTYWALEILAQEGVRIDSSVFPIRHDRYGIPRAKPYIHELSTPSGTLHEFPISTIKMGPINFPVGGGGYFRLYPVRLSVGLLKRVNQQHHRPFVFYVHPWEIDPGQPRLNHGSRLTRARHYLNLSSTEFKLRWLLDRFKFGTVSQSLGAATSGRVEAATAKP